MNNEYENGLYGTNLKYFKSGSAFLEYVDDTSSLKEYPNAAIIDNETLTKRDPKVIYNWELTERQRYELLYFTIKVAGQGTATVTCKLPPLLDTTCLRTISYSTDGENWTTVQNTDNRTSDIEIWTEHLAVTSGYAVMFKADADYLSVYDYDEDVFCGLTFNTSGSSFDIEGNIMSLFYGDDFINKDEITPNYDAGQITYSAMGYLFFQNTDLHSAKNLILPNKVIERCYEDMFEGCEALVEAPELPATKLANYCYAYMFMGCESLTEAPELPATKLANYCYSNMFQGCTSLVNAPELPATELADNCYSTMFRGCTSLVNAPELPAFKLASYCYNNMFEICTSLTEAPELPATTLETRCYEGMFRDCTSLVNAPELPATKLANYCYTAMFTRCTSLVNAPELPATELAAYCYYNMFSVCTSLVNAPELPATKLTNMCYGSMFRGCTSLLNAPELPATELADNCYANMFEGCTSLAVAPVLPAIELVESCYEYMFYDCTNLHYIKMMAKKISENNTYRYTRYWVGNVSNNGTFIKNEDAEYSSFNQHAIPLDNSHKWTVITEKPTEIESDNELVLTSVSNPIVYGILSDGGLDSRHADPNGWTADELASLTLEDIYNYNGGSGGDFTGNNGRSIFYRFDNDYNYDKYDPSDIEGEDRMWTFDEFKYFKGISIIPEECFRGCWGLKSITIPSSVVYIQTYAFHDCWWLEKITLEDSDNKITIDDGLYSNSTISNSAFYYAGLRYFYDTEDWNPSMDVGVPEEDLADGRYISTIDRLKKTNVLIGDRTVIPRYQ